MTDLNPAAEAARETARHDNGRFGAQEHSAPELELDRVYRPGQPIYGTVEFEEYDYPQDDDPTTAAIQKVDVAAILDTLPLDQVKSLVSDPYGYSNDIGSELQAQGVLTHPWHPFVFTPDVDDLEAYIDFRRRNGLTEPLVEKATPSAKNFAAVA